MRTWVSNTVMHSYPGMVALVTTEWAGKQNIMAAGWHSYISYEPPIFGVAIAKERFSHQSIEQSGEFAINFVAEGYADYIQYAGTISGHKSDKLEQLNASYTKGKEIGAPILENAYIAYECKVIDQRTYGDHDWFVGEIVGFYKDEAVFQDNGLPNWEKLSIPLYLGRSQYMIANKEAKVIDLYQDNK
ncbi:flavin reductase family protein [Sutcliffiella halmapala]|uniref:flavin reductase family protein n=1 Tax=Sutcliffiella halmapala TaxID=79882 RepID=UPI000994B247|nr:flavin reductase family protein [Sutcliffiella halmapala]